MAPPNPLQNSAEDFTDADWREAVKNFDPAGGASFTAAGYGEAPLVGIIANEKLPGCLRYCVGYQAVDGDPPHALSRKVPVRHPRWQELICTMASGVGFAPDGRTVNPVLGRKAVKKYVAGAPNVPTFSGYSRYKKAQVTLRFEARPYESLTDGQTLLYVKSGSPAYSFRAEWLRNTTIETDVNFQELFIEGYQLVYAEGEGVPPPYTNPKGNKFAAPFGQLLVKMGLVTTTYHLPENFLFESGTFKPRNVLKSLGKLNRYEWNSYEPETLHHIATKLTREKWALRLGSAESKYLYTMQNVFSYFRPTKGYTGTGASLITTRQGHNNMPYFGGIKDDGTLSSGDLNAGKWFYATRTGNISDPALLETFDIAQLWRCVRDAVED